MARPLFTAEELEELRRADEEIEAEFMITREEREAGNKRDRRCKIENSYGSEAAKRKYYEAKREKIAAAQREYREANREKIAAAQRTVLRDYRKSIGFSQAELGAWLGVSKQLISFWETGAVPINLSTVEAVLPELAEEMRRAGNAV